MRAWHSCDVCLGECLTRFEAEEHVDLAVMRRVLAGLPLTPAEYHGPVPLSWGQFLRWNACAARAMVDCEHTPRMRKTPEPHDA